MLSSIFRFEIRYRLKRPATWAYFAILALFGFFTAIYGNTPASEKVFANSPKALAFMMVVISIFGAMIASAVMGVPVHRDIEHQTKDYLFSYPISERDYLLGRYLGSFAVLLLISLGLHVGLIIGFAVGPFLGLEEPERFGPFNAWAYMQPTLLYYWTNFLLTGTIFFALVVRTRKILSAYVGSVLFFIAYLLGNTLVRDLEKRDLVSILDPFGLNALSNLTRYWTPAEQNSLVVPLEGMMLWNRLLWVGVAVLLFAFTLWRFRFSHFFETRERKQLQADTPQARPTKAKPVSVTQVFSFGYYFRHMFRLAGLELSNIMRDRYFAAMLLAAVLFLLLDGFYADQIFGTPSLPTTYYMLEAKDQNFGLFVFIILIFYTGEVVHRDKSLKFDGIADALPVPNWMVYGSKFLALAGVCLFIATCPLICGVFNQVIKGYYHFDFGMYFTDLYLITLPQYLQLAMLAFFVHILVNQKFPGHVVTIAIWLVMIGIQGIAEYDFNMAFYSFLPTYRVSDMNRFGHFGAPIFWFLLYWTALGAVLLVIGNLLWNRGSESSWTARRRAFRQRFKAGAVVPLVSFFSVFAASGVFIYLNTAVWNPYLTQKQEKVRSANYEKAYSRFAKADLPTITGVVVKVDLQPSERRVFAHGDFTMVNKSGRPLDSLLVSFSTQVYHTDLKTFTIDGQKPERIFFDSLMRFAIYRMPGGPMPAGDTAAMVLEIEAGYKGFPNSGFGRQIVHNGSFFDVGIFPTLGYESGRELTSAQDRKKYGLPIKDYSLPPQDDPYGLSHYLFTPTADFVTFEAVVSTDTDQIAVAPGYLQREWQENGRRYFHYKMEGPMDLFFNISSARYSVTRDTWTNPDGTKGNIEIFHHPTHTRNVSHFVRGVQQSMAYYTKNFAPYQYRQMRILEFPRYASFAQSFPNTVPYAESFGWVADFRDPNENDYAFTVTAHEVAHQWWGHMVSPSATRGANQISESMAEYGSLMVMKQEYGVEAMQKFLKYALDRYLADRANENNFEKTLLDNDDQAYVWYQKGSLVLYALQDYIGEDSLNAGFRRFAQAAAFRNKPPYANTTEWYRYIRSVTPDSLAYFLSDNFEKITLYENRVKKVVSEKTGDDTYRVTLTVETKKLYYDGVGKELGQGDKPNLIDIGVFAEDGKNPQGMTVKTPLYLQKHWLAPGEHTVTVTVKGKPVKGGIDPYNKLIDRIPDDNVKDVE